MEKINHFSIYYINFEKVFEIAMLLDNKEVTSLEEETGKNQKVKIGAKIQATIKLIYSAFAEGEYETSKTSNTKKIIEVKYTNAIFLKSIMDEVKNHQTDLSNSSEGQLVIQDVKLAISNEEEMRQMKLIKQGLLDKFMEEDISIGEMLKTVTEDYSYLLTSSEENKNILIKIPSMLENEFENNYTIDDILNGTTTVIGVYRGIRKLNDFKSTFQFLTATNQEDVSEEVEESAIIESSSNPEGEANPMEENEFHYLDVLAVIQKIKL